MKVTKTSVHRLTIEKNCGCKATREYEDVRYTKPIAEAGFTACEKHEKNKQFAEFAGEMLIEALDKEAESAGKNPFVATARPVVQGDSGGVVATHSEEGGSTQAMGMAMPPKIRQKPVDPLTPKQAHFDRPNMRLPQNTNPTGSLNVALPEQFSPEELEAEGITMDGSIEGVNEDPDVDSQMKRDLAKIEEILDDDDAKTGGVSSALVNRQAVD
jgi:hypothetical protein